MRRSMLLALVLAGSSGLFAATSIYSWMASQAELAKRRIVAPAPAMDLTTVVVAKEDLNFGTVLKKDRLEEVQWPSQSVPQGAYRSVREIFAEQDNRVVTQGMKLREPILKGKLTGPGQRASLSTMLGAGMKAVSIRVNEVLGVSGFILPGDRVDVLMTRTIGDARSLKDSEQKSYSNLLLQNLRVLAIDQTADPNHDAPKIVKTVTVEVSLIDAQKLTLATEIGTLSVVLRESNAIAAAANTQRITMGDLGGDIGDNSAVAAMVPTNGVAQPPAAVPAEPDDRTHAKVIVVRSAEQTEYSVPRTTTGE
jgi:pilus assembly protein CpaB